MDKINSESCICSLLYNPVNTDFLNSSLMEGLQQFSLLNNTCQIGHVIPNNFETIETKVTTFGSVYVGSTLAHQLLMPKSDGSIVKIKNAPEFPCLPLLTHNLTCPLSLALSCNKSIFMEGLDLTIAQCQGIEGTTRSQSDCPEWHKLRQSRITSSVFKDVISRRQDFESLANRFLVNKKIVTTAMKHGITNAANAVLEYATHKNVNVKPCGFIINPQAVYLGTSPDRLVYDSKRRQFVWCIGGKMPLEKFIQRCPIPEASQQWLQASWEPCILNASHGTNGSEWPGIGWFLCLDCEWHAHWTHSFWQSSMGGVSWKTYFFQLLHQKTCLDKEYQWMSWRGPYWSTIKSHIIMNLVCENGVGQDVLQKLADIGQGRVRYQQDKCRHLDVHHFYKGRDIISYPYIDIYFKSQ